VMPDVVGDAPVLALDDQALAVEEVPRRTLVL
jgi:hypothetical protein